MSDLTPLEPTPEDLEEIEAEEQRSLPETLAAFDPLEDLYTDALIASQHTKAKKRRSAGEAPRQSSDHLRRLFAADENWERTRGVAIIDRDSGTLIGNFSEYYHRTVANCRKLIREHQPISIAGAEYVSGWLGEQLQQSRRDWGRGEERREACVDLWLDELMVGAPAVLVSAAIYCGGIVRAELVEETQFASMSGNTILSLPAGVNIFLAMSTDSKIGLRKAIGL